MTSRPVLRAYAICAFADCDFAATTGDGEEWWNSKIHNKNIMIWFSNGGLLYDIWVSMIIYLGKCNLHDFFFVLNLKMIIFNHHVKHSVPCPGNIPVALNVFINDKFTKWIQTSNYKFTMKHRNLILLIITRTFELFIKCVKGFVYASTGKQTWKKWEFIYWF